MAGPNVGGQRLLTVVLEQGGWQGLKGRIHTGEGGGVGLSADDQALDAVAPTHGGEGTDFLVYPPRPRAVRRADGDQTGGLFQRRQHRRAEVAGRRKFFPILEHGGQAASNCADGAFASPELPGDIVGFKRPMQPGGKFPIPVIVADKHRVLHRRPRRGPVSRDGSGLSKDRFAPPQGRTGETKAQDHQRPDTRFRNGCNTALCRSGIA